MLNKIITHAGTPHLDDLMACAIVLADQEVWGGIPAGVTIERRDPTVAELDDPTVVVVDVGGRYEPSRANYDHHQLPRGSRDSAMTLVAANKGLPNDETCGEIDPYELGGSFPAGSMGEFLEEVFPWFRRRAELDSCGPFAAAKAAGTEWSVVETFLGPCEELLLADFVRDPLVVATKLARMIARKFRACVHVAQAMEVYRPGWGDGDFTIADFTDADASEVEEVMDVMTSKISGVAVFRDNRGEGLALLRLHDDPRIDFTRVGSDPEVAFCHPGGFIVKTVSRDIDKAYRLLQGAFAAK